MTERPFHLGDFADLPQEFEELLKALPEAARSGARDTIRRGLTDLQTVDPNLRVRSLRMDAIVGWSKDWWVLPAPTAEAIGTALAAAISALVTGGLKDVMSIILGASVFQGWMMKHGATRVSLEQAIVLRVLRQAHKGTGWTLARVVDELPNGSLLSLAEVTDIVSDLRSLRTVHGEKPAWSIEENPQAPGHYWTHRM